MRLSLYNVFLFKVLLKMFNRINLSYKCKFILIWNCKKTRMIFNPIWNMMKIFRF